MIVTIDLESPDQRRFRSGCFDAQIGQDFRLGGERATLVSYDLYYGGKMAKLTAAIDWNIDLTSVVLEDGIDVDKLIDGTGEIGFTAARIGYVGPHRLESPQAVMLAKLDAYVAARLAEGVDMDPDYNQAQGAAAALRYALTGEMDATLSNLLGNVEEGA